MLPVQRGAYLLEQGPDAGRRIAYIDHGEPDAPAVVMLHGNPTWSFLWRKVIAALPRRRCVAPDLLGLGLSSILPRLHDHTIDRHADALVELLDALRLPRYVLVAQDWGGPMATAIGVRRPDRVAGIVLANTSVLLPSHPRGTAFHRFSRIPVISDLVFRGLGFPQSLLWAVQGDRRSMLQRKVAAAYRWPLRSRGDRIAPLALARMVPDGPDHPSVAPLRRGQAWLQAFEGPMALVWGTRDPILARALPRHERAFPRAPVTTTTAGHFLQEEVPRALAAAVEDVLARG
ncbi:alpha/beta fold hydrolase [Paraliomyxa miuraensis]|uniref:alpha/beta fold hydrolase n=1 Tax=Paraliomyxa miuraensis TaxID=376150 RepID=UPI0022596702|nr:alpha/beta fold hydrolase [Paraliomyxa miuraensis]MCX4243376.1 alpha/beta fold hydrolase [Paraliomyxa miuraensis]